MSMSVFIAFADLFFNGLKVIAPVSTFLSLVFAEMLLMTS